MTRPIVKLPEAFRETTVGEEVAVMRLSDGDFFSLTGTARAIWELIDGQRDAAEIVAALSQRYAADAATLAAEVDRFVSELRQAGLLADG
jgi:hypothetical protein